MPLSYENVKHLRDVIYGSFSAMDIAEPLLSFDAAAPVQEVVACLEATGQEVAGVRRSGRVAGYLRRTELISGQCGEHMRAFEHDDVVSETAPILSFIQSIGRNGCCFVSVLGEVSAVVCLQDLEKPPMRMFLFGIISLAEELVMREIRRRFPDDSWTGLVSSGRLQKAVVLQQERLARRMPADLLSCLQFSDKLEILTRNPETLQILGHTSRKGALKAIKELENLRNNLAHSQSIVTPEWQRIVIFSSNMYKFLERIEESQFPG